MERSSTTLERSSTTQGEQEMQEHRSVVTRKGQITIPAEIRCALDIKEGDKVAFTIEKG